jgi:hypothetical protein
VKILRYFIYFISVHLLYLVFIILYVFHIRALIFVFSTLQLVHQFISIAKTVYCYNVKIIQKLKIV